MSAELFLAGRYLKPRRNAVSLITLSSILGVTLGVAVLMVVLAVMTGFTDLMKEKLIATQAHFQIRAVNGGVIRYPKPVVEAVKRSGGEALPVVMGPLLAQYREGRLDPRVVVLGAPADRIRKHLTSLEVQRGTFELEGRRIVLGSALAARWGARIGDKILLHSVNRLTRMIRRRADGGIELDPGASAALPTEFTVAGICSMGKYDFDNLVIFADADDAAELFDLPWGCATSVFGWGPDPFDQRVIVSSIESKLSPAFRVSTWQQENRQLLEVLAVEKRMMFFLLIFIVLVAAFSITNTLITSVYQKTREIGLLKAIGATDGAVTRVFIAQGLLIGVIGSGCGALLGWLVIFFRNDILRLVSQWTGMSLFPKEFYFFNELPARIVAGDLGFIVVSSIVLCTLGAVIPAWRASRISPAQALRYE